MLNRRKKFTAMAFLTVMSVLMLLGGTYAWRSVSQKVLNEAKSSLNPGGRLHDDFNGLNLSSTQTTDDDDAGRKVKYVYVENFTEKGSGDQIYARIRLDEYLEKGVGAGKATNDLSKLAQPLVDGATLEDKGSWTPY